MEFLLITEVIRHKQELSLQLKVKLGTKHHTEQIENGSLQSVLPYNALYKLPKTKICVSLNPLSWADFIFQVQKVLKQTIHNKCKVNERKQTIKF
jgi:hypothetical protein